MRENVARDAAYDSSRHRGSRAAIILCGGTSRRMGRPKHELIYGAQTAIQRIVDKVSPLVGEVIVVKSAEQELQLHGEVTLVTDHTAAQGPLEGVRTGWAAAPQTATAVFVGGCDLPFLQANVVEQLFTELGDADAIVPIAEGHQHSLCAVYSSRTRAVVEQLINEGERRMTALLERLKVNWIATDQLAAPELDCFFNVNTPEDYARAKARLERDPPGGEPTSASP